MREWGLRASKKLAKHTKRSDQDHMVIYHPSRPLDPAPAVNSDKECLRFQISNVAPDVRELYNTIQTRGSATTEVLIRQQEWYRLTHLCFQNDGRRELLLLLILGLAASTLSSMDYGQATELQAIASSLLASSAKLQEPAFAKPRAAIHSLLCLMRTELDHMDETFQARSHFAQVRFGTPWQLGQHDSGSKLVADSPELQFLLEDRTPDGENFPSQQPWTSRSNEFLSLEYSEGNIAHIKCTPNHQSVCKNCRDMLPACDVTPVDRGRRQLVRSGRCGRCGIVMSSREARMRHFC